MTIDLRANDIPMPAPARSDGLVDLRERRDDVVRRLLARQLTRDTLCTLLPDWAERIDRVSRYALDGRARATS